MPGDESKKDEAREKPIIIRNTTDLQRLKLEKLMKNPDKPIIIPEKPKERGVPTVPDFVRNVMGSSAGAGSGEFHVYRHLRRKEYARQRYMKAIGEKEKLDTDYRDKIEENKKLADVKTAKKRAKRLKRKVVQKNKKPKIEDKSESEETSDSNDSEEEVEPNKDDQPEKVKEVASIIDTCESKEEVNPESDSNKRNEKDEDDSEAAKTSVEDAAVSEPEQVEEIRNIVATCENKENVNTESESIKRNEKEGDSEIATTSVDDAAISDSPAEN